MLLCHPGHLQGGGPADRGLVGGQHAVVGLLWEWPHIATVVPPFQSGAHPHPGDAAPHTDSFSALPRGRLGGEGQVLIFPIQFP